MEDSDMRRRQLTAALLAGALALSLAGCGGDKGTTTLETQSGNGATPVQITGVTSRAISTDNKVTGRVAAEDEATIMVAVSAKCVAVYADAGDRVQRGDILCRLDLDSTLSQYSAARISYDSAVQSYNDQKILLDEQIEVARKQVSVAEEQIPVTEEQIAASEYQLTASREQITAMEESIAAAESQLKASEESLASTEEQIAASEENIAATEEQIAAAEESIAATEENIKASEEAIAAGEIQYEAAKTQIPVLEKQIELLEPKIALAEKNVRDTQALLEIGAASQMELDNAQITLDDALSGKEQAIAGLEQARAGLSAQEAGLSSQRAAVVSAKAGLTSQKAQVTSAKAGLSAQKAQVSGAKAGLEQSRAGLSSQRAGITNSKAQLAQLRAQLTASEAAIDQARSQLSSLELQRDSARVQVQQLITSRDQALAQLEAGVESARSNVQQMDTVLEDVDSQGNVIAPISGILVTFNAVENSYISNAMPLAVINGENQMKLTASVSEALVSKLMTGDAADVYVGALDTNFVAVIRSVERSANAQTSLYTVTLTLPQSVTGLLSGMFADVTFHTDRVDNAVVIPSEAILTSGSTQYVYVVDDSGYAHYVEVLTGLTGSGVTQVTDGLNGGERLVTVGQSYLSDGDPVRIVTGA